MNESKESQDLPSEMMKSDPAFRNLCGVAASDNELLRRGLRRRDNPWCMEIPPVMPEPAMEGQHLQWGENVCGLWSYRGYIAINGKWVDLDPTRISYHPMGGKTFDPHES